MRSLVSAVLGAALLAGMLPADPARADAARGAAARALKTFVIRPRDASAACSLQWRSTPYWLKPGERIVETVIAGWLGTDSGVTPEGLRLGISSVYYESETSTLAVIALEFRVEEDAVRAERTLAERFAKTTAHRFAQRGSYVVVLALPPPTNQVCADWMWEELGRRLAALPR